MAGAGEANAALEYRVGVVKRLLAAYERTELYQGILRGMQYVGCDPEKRSITLEYETSHRCAWNNRGAVHGGAVGTLLDEASTLAMVLYAGEKRETGTMTECQVTYMGELKKGRVVVLEAVCKKKGRSMVFLESAITDKVSGKPLARCMQIRYVGRPWPEPIEVSALHIGQEDLPKSAFCEGKLVQRRLVDVGAKERAKEVSKRTLARTLAREDLSEDARRNFEVMVGWATMRQEHETRMVKEGREEEAIFDDRFSCMALEEIDVEKQMLVYGLVVGPLHQNVAKSIHSGAVVTIVDWTTSTSFMAFNPFGIGGVSVSIAVQFLRPVKEGTSLRIEAQCRKLGKLLAFLQARFYDKKTGELVVLATHMYFGMHPKL